MSGAGWPAPAKLNLFLHVTGRRADGFHDLQTLFQFLDLCDTIHIDVTDDGRITRGGGWDGTPWADDLAHRAARDLQRHTGCPLGARITVDKRIPVGSGLGGGSSDAATVLVVLDRLWNTNLGTPSLAELGLGLGADVPVFVHGHAAWAEGLGEQLTPAQPSERWYVVVTPPWPVATAAVYADAGLRRDRPRQPWQDIDPDTAGNDLEPVVRQRHPEVGKVLDWLGTHGPARLSGSGGSAFMAVADESAARTLCAQAPAEWRAVAAHGLNQSPLQVAVAAMAAR